MSTAAVFLTHLPAHLSSIDRATPTVTQWPQRLGLTVVTLAVVALAVFGMWRGWRSRGRRQAQVTPPQEFTGPVAEVLAVSEGRYLGTTKAGDWLDRIVAHGLGTPSAASLNVLPAGAVITREGAPDLYIPLADLEAVRVDRAAAGQVLERDGIIVLTWRLGELRVDTGFRGERSAAHAGALHALEALLPQELNTRSGGTA